MKNECIKMNVNKLRHKPQNAWLHFRVIAFSHGCIFALEFYGFLLTF